MTIFFLNKLWAFWQNAAPPRPSAITATEDPERGPKRVICGVVTTGTDLIDVQL